MHQFFNIAVTQDTDDAIGAQNQPAPMTSICGGTVLELAQGRAFVGDIDVGLSPAEFATVRLLFGRRGVPMSRESILVALPLSDGPIDPRLIDVYISRARTKFASAGLEDAITTVWGRGYMAASSGEDDAGPAAPRSRDLCASLAMV